MTHVCVRMSCSAMRSAKHQRERCYGHACLPQQYHIHVHTMKVSSSSQAAWGALINATPCETLQNALSTELLGVFFSLGGTPSGQALPWQLIFTPEITSQVNHSPGHILMLTHAPQMRAHCGTGPVRLQLSQKCSIAALACPGGQCHGSLHSSQAGTLGQQCVPASTDVRISASL